MLNLYDDGQCYSARKPGSVWEALGEDNVTIKSSFKRPWGNNNIDELSVFQYVFSSFFLISQCRTHNKCSADFSQYTFRNYSMIVA